jgi:ATP/maltotriose-dependent transcriptional regulator MalT
MLQTLQQYARERLVASGAAETHTRRHAKYYLELVERAEPELTGAKQRAWLERLEQEHENLRAVLQWTLDGGGDAELGLRLAGAVWSFWWVHGHLREGRRWLEGLLALAPSGGARLAAARAKALSGAGALATEQGDYDRAGALLEETLALSRELGNKRWGAWPLMYLGVIARYHGDYRRAATLLEESLALRRDVEDKWGSAWSLTNLGRVASEQGDYPRAAGLLKESLSLFQDLGDKRGIARSLTSLARIARDRGDHRRAAALLEESLALSLELGDRRSAALGVEELAAVACAQEQPERAARLFGAAQALREAIGAPLPPTDQARYDHSVAAARARLREDAFAAAWAEGRAMAQEQAVAYALQVVATAPSDEARGQRAGSQAPSGGGRKRLAGASIERDAEARPRAASKPPTDLSAGLPSPPTARLTTREVEIVRLVAAGRTNREIAAELVLSVRTVERHIENLYAKLGVHGPAARAAVASSAARSGLLSDA